MLACLEHLLWGLFPPARYIFELLHKYFHYSQEYFYFYYSVPLYSVTKKRERSGELSNFMGFTVIMIDDIVF